MEWVYVYLSMIDTTPVLGVGDGNYKTQEAYLVDNAGRDDNIFWCVRRNWLDDDQRQLVRAVGEP